MKNLSYIDYSNIEHPLQINDTPALFSSTDTISKEVIKAYTLLERKGIDSARTGFYLDACEAGIPYIISFSIDELNLIFDEPKTVNQEQIDTLINQLKNLKVARRFGSGSYQDISIIEELKYDNALNAVINFENYDLTLNDKVSYHLSQYRTYNPQLNSIYSCLLYDRLMRDAVEAYLTWEKDYFYKECDFVEIPRRWNTLRIEYSTEELQTILEPNDISKQNTANVDNCRLILQIEQAIVAPAVTDINNSINSDIKLNYKVINTDEKQSIVFDIIIITKGWY